MKVNKYTNVGGNLKKILILTLYNMRRRQLFNFLEGPHRPGVPKLLKTALLTAYSIYIDQAVDSQIQALLTFCLGLRVKPGYIYTINKVFTLLS